MSYAFRPNKNGLPRRIRATNKRYRGGFAELLDPRVLMSVSPNAISINFEGGGNNGSPAQLLSATSSAGVVPRTNYNNAADGFGTISNLLASNGTASAATLQYTSGGTWSAVGATYTPATADQTLNDGFINSTTTTPISVSVTGVPFSTYDVYIYEQNDAAGRVSLTTDVNTGQAFYGSAPNPTDANHETGAAGTYQYIAATSTSATSPTASADYVLFATQTGSTFSFTESSPNNNGYVSGFEIVNHVTAAASIPLLTSATGSPGTVTLNWNVAANADTYTVYRSGPGTMTATAIATNLISPAYVDTTVTNGSTYTYYVTATNSYGTTAASNSLQVTPMTAPVIVTAASANPSPLTGTSDTLSVSATDSLNGIDLTYSWATTGTPPAPVTFSANTNHSASTTTATFSQSGSYSFIVTVANSQGASVTSTVSLTVTDSSAVPGQPTGVSASWNSSSVVISWLPSISAATYDILRATSSGGEGNTPLYTGITGTTYTDTSVVSGSNYYYEVVAISSTSISSMRSAEVMATNPVDVLSYHGATLSSQGVNSQETELTPSNVNTSSFALDFATSITDVPNLDGIPASALSSAIDYTAPDGQPYGEPLVKTGVSITTGPYAGTLRNIVFVTNQLGSLFAIDADGGTILWKDSFIYNADGNPNPLNPTVPNGTTAIPGGFGTETNSQDVSPWICVVGTPVIDAATNSIYLITNTRYVSGGSSGDQLDPHYLYTIHKIDMSDGVDTSSVFADTTLGYANPGNPTYTYNSGPYVVGTGEGAIKVNGQSRVYFNAVRQMVRPALEIYNGRVYLASASHGDNQPYHGWILTFDVNSVVIDAVFNATPNGDEGGIWSGGDGVVIDAQGNIYVMTGNGTFDGSFTTANGVTTYSGLDADGFPDLGDYGDAFIKLQLDPTTSATNQNLNGWGLKVVDYFTPQNNAALDSSDSDLGSGGPILLPASAGSTAHPNLILGAGKEGELYLLDTNNLGKFTYNDSGSVQEVGGAANGVLSTPSYFNGRIYVSPGYGGDLASWTIANAAINSSSEQKSTDSIAFPGSSPYISANGTENGIVWVIDKGTGSLRAYDAEKLSDELWTSNLDESQDALPGGSVKFSVATPVNGRVYAVSNNDLVVYGPPLPPTSAPAAPAGLTAVGSGASTIGLTWTDNSNNEAGFSIERSVDGVNFTQMTTVGVNITTYTDSGLSPATKYYYRVRAYNSYNGTSDSAYTNVASATTSSIGSQQPVDLYHFDEDTGTTANDSAGTDTGTLVGSPLPAWTAPGRVGTSDLTFGGNGQYNQSGESTVHLANDLSPILGGTSSIDFWIKTTQTGNNTHWQAPAVTGVEQAAGNNDINWGTLNAAGDIGIYVGDAGGVYSTNPINDGSWHNVAITRNASSGVVQLYVDGVLNATGTFDTGDKTSPIQMLGALEVVSYGETPTGANYISGQLDEVAIYNVVLDPAVINSLALAPPAPTSLAVTAASGTELDLTWTSNSPYATGYVLQQEIGSGAWTSLPTLPSGTTSYDATGLTPSTQYSYRVQAIDSAGASAFSNTVIMTTPVPPATPTDAKASEITTTQIYLTWTNNATNATGYRILRANIGGEFVVITPPNGLPSAATSYLDTGLTPGTEYDYHIQCYNIAGVSDFTGTHTGTLTVAPSSGSAVFAGSNTINVNWTSPAYDGDDQDLTFNIYRGATSGGEAAKPIATGLTSSDYLDTGLSLGVTYYYEVTAVDLGGESAVSNEAVGVDADSWTGAVDGVNWNVAGNWSSGLVPTLNDVVNIGLYSGTIKVAAGTFGVNAIASQTPLEIESGSIFTLSNSSTLSGGLTVDSGGAVVIAGSETALEVTDLNITVGGNVDVGTNFLVARNTSLGTITSAVASGYDNGSWSGTGIISSAARTSTAHLFAVGVLVNSNGSGGPIYGSGGTFPEFGGYIPSLNDVLVRYTYLGDANLDGRVDGSDYSLIDNGFLNRLTGWSNGDFDYNNTIDGSDYTLIDNAFNAQGMGLPTAIVASSASISAHMGLAISGRSFSKASFQKSGQAVLPPACFATTASLPSTPLTAIDTSGEDVVDRLRPSDSIFRVQGDALERSNPV